MKNRNSQEENQRKFEEDLAVVFEKSSEIEFEENKNGIVTILLGQNHPIQRFLRRLGVGIPRYKRIKLDALGSFVFRNIDGCLSVGGLGELVEAEFGEKAHPIYPRLLTFLSYMERQSHYIKRVGE